MLGGRVRIGWVVRLGGVFWSDGMVLCVVGYGNG